jgi:hypothetical protein
MMRIAIAIAIAGAAVFLGGCATQGKQLLEESTRALAAAPVCCTTLATAIRQPLPVLPQPAEALIDAKSQAFNFGGNKAFFVLYELPKYDQPYSIVLTSVGAGTLQDSALLIPRVATYDGEFKVQRFFDEKTLRNRGNNLERTVFINPSDAGERYLAIYGSDLSASIERAYSMVTVTPVYAGPVMFNMYNGVDGKSVLRSSPAGKLQLEVRGLPTR